MLQQTNEVQRLRDRCDTLEEENRQLKETFAPIRAFPHEWKLRPAHHRILSCLMESANGIRSYDQLRAVACRDDSECDEALKVHVSTLRRRVRELGIEIKTRYGVGYELPAASRELIKRALA